MTAQEIELIRQLIERMNRLERRVALADTLELASGGGSYTNEEAQDAVGTILTDTATIDFTYTDATPSITADVINDSITFAKMQNIATDSLIGRDTASSGDPENILLNATLSMDGSGNLQRAALTGDVTASAGSNTTAIGSGKVLTAMIADDNVTAAKLANMAQNTIKGRITASTGDPEDLSAANVRTIINVASGADVTGAAITALATKTTPVDADAVVITDSAASDAPKRTTWANIKATLKTYFDTLYGRLASANTWSAANVFTSTINIGNDALSANTFHIGTTDGTLAMARYAASTGGPAVVYKKSRNASVGSHTIVQSNDEMGKFIFQGSDGSAYRSGAQIVAYVDGTPGASDMPGRIEFQVSPDGAIVPVTAMVIKADKSVGFGGVTTPAAAIDILQPTLGSAVQRLSSTATNDDPTEIVYQNSATTTDATVTTLHTFTIPASTTYAFDGVVVARRTGGSSGTAEDGAAYKIQAVFQNVAGTAVAIGSAKPAIGESQAAWDITIDVTGATARVRVTGAANNNITWHMTARVYPVSS